ncbi:MAG: MaoC family dehydratase [Pseudomonadota bacterium]
MSDLRSRVGEEIGVSRWFTIDQARIDGFAEVTDDHQFVHVDPARAAETLFGGTVAHGFLTLSLLSAMTYDAVPAPAEAAHGLNYGLDRARFITPVPSGARVRGRFVLAALDETADYAAFVFDITVEIEEVERPALVARWLLRSYFG